MKIYTYSSALFQVIQWTGRNFTEISRFVSYGGNKQFLVHTGINNRLMLFKDNRENGKGKPLFEGDYVIRRMSDGFCWTRRRELEENLVEVKTLTKGVVEGESE